MTEDHAAKIISQALAMSNNFFSTGRPNKALEMLNVVQKLSPNNHLLKQMMQKIYCVAVGDIAPDLDNEFGKLWKGESLEGKSIEIFCDQGIGDTINLLRYVRQLKSKYGCKIVLNCYAFFNQFERLINTQDYIDEFTPFHNVCDYTTNIMSIPALLNGLKFEIYYPVHFLEVMEAEIPPQIELRELRGLRLDGKHKVGVVWQTNAENPLSLIKSLPVDAFKSFLLPEVTLYCLQPKTETPDWVTTLPIEDLHDTTAFIQQCDCVVSVDTAVLHLAGAIGKKTFGLLPCEADPRWGTGVQTCWYPSVELFRQTDDWSEPISGVKERLVSFFKMV
jgi:hypothetical protein